MRGQLRRVEKNLSTRNPGNKTTGDTELTYTMTRAGYENALKHF